MIRSHNMGRNTYATEFSRALAAIQNMAPYNSNMPGIAGPGKAKLATGEIVARNSDAYLNEQSQIVLDNYTALITKYRNNELLTANHIGEAAADTISGFADVSDLQNLLTYSNMTGQQKYDMINKNIQRYRDIIQGVVMRSMNAKQHALPPA